MISLIVTKASPGTAVTLEQFKANSRISSTDEDTFITALLARAQEFIEERTDRALDERGLLLVTDTFPESGVIELPRPPLVSVESVKYIDTDGAEQTIDPSEYDVDAGAWPGSIFRFGDPWPQVLPHRTSVRIAFTAGGVEGIGHPLGVLQAITLLAASWYENREATTLGTASLEMPYAVEALINSTRWHG